MQMTPGSASAALLADGGGPREQCRRALRWLALPLLWFATAAGAVSVSGLYETDQRVETTRDAAFVEALKTVVVRVSGQRDAPARLGAAINDPRRLVQRFGFTADNVLQVAFDSVSVDRLLQSAGLPIWGRERPATLVLLQVRDANGYSYWINGDQPTSSRAAIDAAARQRGLPLKWPAVAPQLAGAEDSTTALQEADRYGANAVLVGRLETGSFVRWTLISSDGTAQVSGSLEDGLHLAADTFARYFAASGSAIGNVTMEVAGITDLDAYAATLNYLEGMTLVRSVAVEQVSGDTMRFKLAVRGDAATLRRAIALDSRLVPQADSTFEPSTEGGPRLAFRYRP